MAKLTQRLRMVGSTPASESAVSRKSTPSGGSSMTFSRALADSSFMRSTWYSSTARPSADRLVLKISLRMAVTWLTRYRPPAPMPSTEMASRTMPVSIWPLSRLPALPTARQHSPRSRASAGAPPAG